MSNKLVARLVAASSFLNGFSSIWVCAKSKLCLNNVFVTFKRTKSFLFRLWIILPSCYDKSDFKLKRLTARGRTFFSFSIRLVLTSIQLYTDTHWCEQKGRSSSFTHAQTRISVYSPDVTQLSLSIISETGCPVFERNNESSTTYTHSLLANSTSTISRRIYTCV